MADGMVSRRKVPNAGFGDWLRVKIRETGLSYTELARQMGVTQPMISGWVAGDRSPSPANCDKLAVALALDVDEVLTRAGHRPKLLTDVDPAIAEVVKLMQQLPEVDQELIADFARFRLGKVRQRRLEDGQ